MGIPAELAKPTAKSLKISKHDFETKGQTCFLACWLLGATLLSKGENQCICQSVLSYYHNESLQIINRQLENC
ncbi:MAG: hypothetical protein EAZ86_19905 [Oscillatoriales cyanobacterium]|nr:MAG: hypothetical protein EAZ86_19905 [Oscillatoriales cyanobacterium]